MTATDHNTASTDDYPATRDTNGTLPMGGKISARVDYTGDRDWFKVYLRQGVQYAFDLEGQGHGEGTMKVGEFGAKVFLEQAPQSATAALPLTSDSTFTHYTLTAQASGYHYLSVYSDATYFVTPPPGTDTGTYTLHAGLAPYGAGVNGADDHGDTLAAATRITTGSPVNGRIGASGPQGDQDVFKLAVQAGHTYTFVVAKETSSAQWQADLALRAGSSETELSNPLELFSQEGAAQYGVWTASFTGDYVVSINSLFNRTGTALNYTLTARDVAPDDVGNSRQDASTLAVDGSAQARINYTGDADWYKIQLQPGISYAVILRGNGSGEGTLPVTGKTHGLKLYDANGANVPFKLDAVDGIHTIAAGTGGEYYVAVQDQAPASSSGMDSYSYTLHLQTTQGDAKAPVLVSPPSAAAPIGLFDNISLTFSEPVSRLYDIDIKLVDANGDSVFSELVSTGNGYLINPLHHLKPGATYTLRLPPIVDASGNEYLGSQTFTYATPAADAQASAGNDMLAGPGNGTHIDGGAGRDTVIYDDAISYYDVTRSGNDIRVKPVALQQADVLTGVERLLFGNTAMAFDTDGAGGQAYRLYQSAFNRAPDQAGIGYWIAQMDKGASLYDVAHSFLYSDEFQALFGSTSSDFAFISTLYQNVLHRAGEQAGIDYWSGVLASGAPRPAVLASFSESPENQAAMLKVIGNGFDYIPYG